MHVILVHGENTTADCWNGLPDGLQDAADSVSTVALPGRKWELDDKEHLPKGEEFLSGIGMADYVQSIVAAFPEGNARDVILIGHAMGGNLISHVAAAHPNRIAGLIYVAAMLPDDGQSGHDLLKMVERDPMYHPRMAYMDFKPYFESFPLIQSPIEPMDEKFARSAAFDRLNRVYIRCLSDHVIPPTTQTEMVDAYEETEPETLIVTLKAGHFPQFENLEQLTAVIKALVINIRKMPDPELLKAPAKDDDNMAAFDTY